jgi:hypothetical protein
MVVLWIQSPVTPRKQALGSQRTATHSAAVTWITSNMLYSLDICIIMPNVHNFVLCANQSRQSLGWEVPTRVAALYESEADT